MNSKIKKMVDNGQLIKASDSLPLCLKKMSGRPLYATPAAADAITSIGESKDTAEAVAAAVARHKSAADFIGENYAKEEQRDTLVLTIKATPPECTLYLLATDGALFLLSTQAEVNEVRGVDHAENSRAVRQGLIEKIESMVSDGAAIEVTLGNGNNEDAPARFFVSRTVAEVVRSGIRHCGDGGKTENELMAHVIMRPIITAIVEKTPVKTVDRTGIFGLDIVAPIEKDGRVSNLSYLIVGMAKGCPEGEPAAIFVGMREQIKVLWDSKGHRTGIVVQEASDGEQVRDAIEEAAQEMLKEEEGGEDTSN